MKKIWACVLLAGACVAVMWLPSGAALEYTPDSWDYEAIATNLAIGNGYRNSDGTTAADRSPVYPVLLSLLYDSQTEVWRGRIIWLHRALAFSAGATLVLYGAYQFGRIGLVCSALAAILIGSNDELQFAGKQVLTELPATALLLLCLIATEWANRGSPRRECMTALCHVLLFMTRSALIFCGIAYGVCQIWNALRYRQAGAWVRTAIFGGICAVSLVAWSGYLWFATGQIVLLTTTGSSNVAAGLNPCCVAESRGLPVPRTDAELETFWTAAPLLKNSDDGTKCIWLALKSPWQAVKLLGPKFKIAFSRTPGGVFFLGVCGFVLQGLVGSRNMTWIACTGQQVGDASTFWLSQTAYFTAFAICTLGVCGLSHPVFKVAVIGCAVTIAALAILPGIRMRRSKQALGGIGQSIAIVVAGFVMMTAVAFGLPRFTRPFLPPLYLSAAMCVPLAFRLLMTSEQFRTTPIPPHSSTAV